MLRFSKVKPPTMVVNGRLTLWVSLMTLALAYGLLGWQLSAYHVSLAIATILAVCIFTVLLLWGGGLASRMMRIGPRSVLLMLIISLTITLAVATPTLFTLLLILLATQLLARLEFQTAGFNRFVTMGMLSSVSCIALSCGWLVGRSLYPSNALWLSWKWLPFV
ncbi:MAG: hypothetical protein ACFCU8_16650 [Thermosynechococcaceae cyanobacterium]